MKLEPWPPFNMQRVETKQALERLGANLVIAGMCAAAGAAARRDLARVALQALHLDMTELQIPPTFDDERDPGRLAGDHGVDTYRAMFAHVRRAWGRGTRFLLMIANGDAP